MTKQEWALFFLGLAMVIGGIIMIIIGQYIFGIFIVPGGAIMAFNWPMKK